MPMSFDEELRYVFVKLLFLFLYSCLFGGALKVENITFVRHPHLQNTLRDFDFCVETNIDGRTLWSRVSHEVQIEAFVRILLADVTNQQQLDSFDVDVLQAFVEHRASTMMVMRREIQREMFRQPTPPKVVIQLQECTPSEFVMTTVENGTFSLTTSMFNLGNQNDWAFYFNLTCPSSVLVKAKGLYGISFDDLQATWISAQKYLCPGGELILEVMETEVAVQIMDFLGSPAVSHMVDEQILMMHYKVPSANSSDSKFLGATRVFLIDYGGGAEDSFSSLLHFEPTDTRLFQVVKAQSPEGDDMNREKRRFNAHTEIWHLISQDLQTQMDERFLVVEEDSKIMDRYTFCWNSENCECLTQLNAAIDIIWLGHDQISNLHLDHPVQKNLFKFSEYPRSVASGPYAYILSKKGAGRLLQLANSLHGEDLQYNEFMVAAATTKKILQAFKVIPPLFLKADWEGHLLQHPSFSDLDMLSKDVDGYQLTLSVQSPTNGSTVSLPFEMHIFLSASGARTSNAIVKKDLAHSLQIEATLCDPIVSGHPGEIVKQYFGPFRESTLLDVTNMLAFGCNRIEVKCFDWRNQMTAKNSLYIFHQNYSITYFFQKQHSVYSRQ